MKEIIYLDTDFLHSFIAQTNDGLPLRTDKEETEESKQSLTQQQGFNSRNSTEIQGTTGKINIPGIVETPEGKIKIHIEPGKTSSENTFWSESEVGKQLISKTLHDNALNELLEYLKTNKLIIQTDIIKDNYKYVELNAQFELMDLNLFEIAFSDEMIETMIRDNDANKNKELRDVNSKNIDDKSKKKLRDQITKKYNEENENIKKTFPEYSEILKLLKKFLPTYTFIKSSNSISPLKEEFLRESRNQLLFKYGNKSDNTKVKIIGKVTRKLKKDNSQEKTESEVMESFDEFKGVIDEMMIEHLKLIKYNDYILNPIAIYFE